MPGCEGRSTYETHFQAGQNTHLQAVAVLVHLPPVEKVVLLVREHLDLLQRLAEDLAAVLELLLQHVHLGLQLLELLLLLVHPLGHLFYSRTQTQRWAQ